MSGKESYLPTDRYIRNRGKLEPYINRRELTGEDLASATEIAATVKELEEKYPKFKQKGDKDIKKRVKKKIKFH